MARSVILCSWSPWWTAFGTWPTMNRRSRETSDIARVETLSIWHRNVSPDLYMIMSSFIWSCFIFNGHIIWPYFTMWKIFGSPNVAWRTQRLWIEQRPMVRWIVWPLQGRTQWPLNLRDEHGHGSLNVPIEHHPTIRYMVYNNYYKVMSNLPKMGHLPTPHGDLGNKQWWFTVVHDLAWQKMVILSSNFWSNGDSTMKMELFLEKMRIFNHKGDFTNKNGGILWYHVDTLHEFSH